MADIHSEALEKAHQKMREMRAAGFKPVILDPVEKSKANPNSLKLAIRAHCWTCCGGEGDSGVKVRVRDCGLQEKCSLWPHRPWQKVSGRINDDGEVDGVDLDNDAEDESTVETV